MASAIVLLEYKRLEHSLTKIEADIADAGELVNKAKELTAGSEVLLIRVQQELEELYLSLDQESK